MSYHDSYGKYFRSTYSGSMKGAGPDVFAVWGYVIANTTNSQVRLNPVAVAQDIGKMTPERVAAVIEYLCAPDSWSTNKEHEGRRLLPLGEHCYWVVSHKKYRAMKTDQTKREYNKIKQREWRAREKAKKQVAKERAALGLEADDVDEELN